MARILDEDGLEYGYNVRNLVAVQGLDRLRRAIFESESIGEVLRMSGQGTYEAPFEVPELPADSRTFQRRTIV